MKKKMITGLMVAGLAGAAVCECSESSSQRGGVARMLNPICPPGMYLADPQVRQMPDGRVYIYGSRDDFGNTWCSRSYNVLSSADMIHWDVDLMSFATAGQGKQTDYTDHILWAPDCIERNGTYYLYYCLEGGGDDEGVATSKSPYGPFVGGRKIEGVNGIDPAVFIDDDGQGYLYWGQGSAKVAKLTKDMLAIDKSTIKDGVIVHNDSKFTENPADLKGKKEHWFNEGGSIFKRNGIYYYVYAQGGRHTRNCCACLAYATSRSPLGPFTYRGIIIDNMGSAEKIVNNHGCVTQVNGKWYVFYHRPTHGGPSMRKVCVEPIAFNPDGTIPEVKMTTQGISGPINPLLRMDAARACLMSGQVRVAERRMGTDVVVDCLAGIKDGDTATWRYFDFSGKNVRSFTCKTWDTNLAGKIEIRLDNADGELIGTCEVAPKQANTAYAVHSAAVKPVTGKHAVVLVFKAATPDPTNPDLMNLDWFIFSAGK